MPRKGSIIASAPMADLLKQAGAERVSDKAAKAMAQVLMEVGNEVATEAVKLAQHAGRKTIKAEDIQLAKRVI